MNNILILGGTSFIGRNLVEKLIADKRFDITLFNRGKTNPALFPNIKRINGDRNSDDLSKIFRFNWDYIVDLTCFHPASLESVLRKVNSTLKRYIFISTCSVYNQEICKESMRAESSPILPCSNEQMSDFYDASYGNRKAECERILINSGFRYSILRPALVYGQYDPTDRLYYWLYQVKTSDRILLPEAGKRQFSTTYVEDLVYCILKVLDSKQSNDIYNVTSHPKTSISQIVETSKKLLNKTPESINVGAEFLEKHQVSQWTDVPLWLNSDYFTFSNEHVKDKLGLEPTGLNDSLCKTINYYKALNWNPPKCGITIDKNILLIEKLME